jgi:transposase
MNQTPRLDEAQIAQVVTWFASGMSVDEVHATVLADPDFFDYSRGTIANWQTRFKDRIFDLKRARSVQMEEILFARQATRVDGLSLVLQKELRQYVAAVLDSESGR